MDNYFLQFKTDFDLHLEAYLEEKIKKINTIAQYERFDSFWEHVKKNSQNGKRIRPYMSYLGYQGAGGKDFQEWLPLGLSLELLHIFALIHDDIMDRSELRHNIPTIHSHITTRYQTENNSDAVHLGNSQAMLIGDLILSFSEEQIRKYAKVSPHFEDISNTYQNMLEEVMMGQMLDIDMSSLENTDQAIILKKTYLKTAGYSFVHPFEIGIFLAGGKIQDFLLYQDLQKNLGTLFQIQDDLLDITSESNQLHKTVLSDVKEGQHTIFSYYIQNIASDTYKNEFKKYFKKNWPEKEEQNIQKLFVDSGAIHYGLDIIREYSQKIQDILSKIPNTHPIKNEIEHLVQFILNRKK